MAAPDSSIQNPRSPPLPPAILLMGPTASGKTGVAVELVERLPCEIVSVDSALVYRHMDIGTAKPDAATLARAPHHLIDILEPTESYSAARFRADALRLMAQITARGRIPLLTGGTLLYFKALVEGLSELPEADPVVRAEIEARAKSLGWPALHADLAASDPRTAARFDPRDAQRIQRALEVQRLTGRPLSAFLGREASAPLPYRLVRLALLPGDRALLHRRIARRFEAMLAQGLIDEVRWLRSHYPLTPAMPAMRCVGYRQVWQFLEGEYGLAELKDKAVAATRQLAKRQLTWLRAIGGITSFDCLAPDLPQQVWLHLERELQGAPAGS